MQGFIEYFFMFLAFFLHFDGKYASYSCIVEYFSQYIRRNEAAAEIEKVLRRRSGQANFFARSRMNESALGAVEQMMPYLIFRRAVHCVAREGWPMDAKCTLI